MKKFDWNQPITWKGFAKMELIVVGISCACTGLYYAYAVWEANREFERAKKIGEEARAQLWFAKESEKDAAE